jgi:hypothetical protein
LLAVRDHTGAIRPAWLLARLSIVRDWIRKAKNSLEDTSLATMHTKQKSRSAYAEAIALQHLHHEPTALTLLWRNTMLPLQELKSQLIPEMQPKYP